MIARSAIKANETLACCHKSDSLYQGIYGLKSKCLAGASFSAHVV